MRKYCHLEKKGNSWLLLHTEGMLFDSEPIDGGITICRDECEKIYRPTMILDDGRPLIITKYTVMTPIDVTPAYYLDELDDHTFRIYHTTSFFEDKHVRPKEKQDLHRHLNKIRLEVITDMTKPIEAKPIPAPRSPSRVMQQILADRSSEVTFDDTI
ncbi:hypothetical protein D3C81_1152110 [compost metagenome]